MKRVTEKNNFVYLLASLVILLLVGALVDQFPSTLGEYVFQIVSVVTLALSVVDFRASRARLNTSLGFTLSAFIIVALGIALDAAGMSYLHLILLFLFYCWATWVAAKQVLFTGPIDGSLGFAGARV